MAQRALAREHGFTLIEAVLAMAIFAGVVTALAGVLTSSIAARSLSTDKTTAEQVANDQIEWIRSLDYTAVGLTGSGNPVGDVDAGGDQSAEGGPTIPSDFTATITIKWVDDPTPTSYSTKANYKNVTISVVRARDGKVMTQQSTQVGPRQRAAFGGIDKGAVTVFVKSFYPDAADPGVVVNLTTGPSAPLSDTSDGSGNLTFPALQPATGTTYYDLVVPTYDNGWIAYPDAATTHFQLPAAGVPVQKVLRVYKPVTLTFQPQDSDGTTFSNAAVFTVTGPEGITKDFTYNAVTGAAITVTSLLGSGGVTIPLPPGSYTITPKSGMYASTVTQSVPANLGDYPTDVTESANVTSDPLGSIQATVTSGGSPVAGATVSVTGGPRSITTALTATTDASGVATISGLPAGSGYSVAAAKGSLSATTQTGVPVTAGGTKALAFTFPTGSVKAVVTWATVAVSGATVTLSGGPAGISVSGTSDATGAVTFTNIPVGSGYTVTSVKAGQTGTASATVTVGATTTVPVAMPTVSLVATVSWLGVNITGATVSLSGGPMSLATINATTVSGGQASFSNVPAGGSYTLSATRNGQTTTLTSQSFTTSPTTSVGIALPTGTIRVNTATWAALPAGSATVTITGGPSGSGYSGTTDGTGFVDIAVPTTNATYPYTVTTAKNGGTVASSVTTLATGATSSIAPALSPTKTLTLTIQAAAVVQKSKAVTVSITGGPNGTANAAPAYGGAYTTNASTGTVAIVVPAGTGNYTVKVYVTGCTGTTNRTNGTGTTVSAAAATTTATINMTTSTCPPSLP